MGPGAADLQLHIGRKNISMQNCLLKTVIEHWHFFLLLSENAQPLPLKHVPESCGFSMQQNALGLVLNVPYNACSVLTEVCFFIILKGPGLDEMWFSYLHYLMNSIFSFGSFEKELFKLRVGITA